MCGETSRAAHAIGAEDRAVPESVQQLVEHAVEGIARAVVGAVPADEQEDRRDAGGDRRLVGSDRQHERPAHDGEHRSQHAGTGGWRWCGDEPGRGWPSGRREPSTPVESPEPGPRSKERLLKTYDAKDIRNVLLVGHGGSGKTTLLEAMLFTSGAITRMGTVEDGNTVSDHDPDEQRKGISVSLSMAPVEWEGVKINVLDAPGYADFIGDLRSAVRAVDAVIVVVSAVDGVEVQTEVAWELAVEAGLPRAIFVNKLDRERSSFQTTLEQLVSSFGNQVAPLELPIGAEHEFSGVADLLHEKADLYPSGPIAQEGEWPDEIHAIADPAREKLMEAVAEADDDLIEKYLEEGALPEEEIVTGVKAGFANARIAPVICGSAAKAIGVDRLLAFIAEEFPSPLDREPVEVTTKAGDDEAAAVRRGRTRHGVRLQDGVGPVRRPHHDVPRVQRQGAARLHRVQRDAEHRGADRPAVRVAGQGARERLGGRRR